MYIQFRKDWSTKVDGSPWQVDGSPLLLLVFVHQELFVFFSKLFFSSLTSKYLYMLSIIIYSSDAALGLQKEAADFAEVLETILKTNAHDLILHMNTAELCNYSPCKPMKASHSLLSWLQLPFVPVLVFSDLWNILNVTGVFCWFWGGKDFVGGMSTKSRNSHQTTGAVCTD